MQQMIAQKEKDVATLIDSMPIDMLNLIEFQKKTYQLFSHQQHRVENSNMYKIEANWTC